VWMAENLQVTHYRNGDTIPNVTNQKPWATKITNRDTWANLTGAYCNYDNHVTHGSTYGRLYNWFAVNDPRGLAPKGWHVPSDAEWQTLVDYLGGSYVAGGKMKESGTRHWKAPNTGATNESGFSALPGGFRASSGTYRLMGVYATFWSSSGYSLDKAWTRELTDDNSKVSRDYIGGKRFGFSVRCVRD